MILTPDQIRKMKNKDILGTISNLLQHYCFDRGNYVPTETLTWIHAELDNIVILGHQFEDALAREAKNFDDMMAECDIDFPDMDDIDD